MPSRVSLSYSPSVSGDLHRKRQLWESAERYFIQAKEVLDDWKTSKSCELCILTGKALLEMRTGDLVRHHWLSQQSIRKEHGSHSNITEHCPAKSLTSALSHYTAAVTSLSELLDDFDGTDVLKEEGSSNPLETQKQMLRSLQMKGKSVSLEILSNNLEEAEVSGPKTRKSKLRKSVQTRKAVLSNSKAVATDMEGDISSLCDGMRLTTLGSDLVDSLQVDSLKTVLEPSHSRNGLRSKRRTVLAKVSLQEASREEQVNDLDLFEDSSTVKQKSLVQKDSELASGGVGRTFSIEEWPAYKWSQFGRKLMSRVLLQRGASDPNSNTR